MRLPWVFLVLGLAAGCGGTSVKEGAKGAVRVVSSERLENGCSITLENTASTSVVVEAAILWFDAQGNRLVRGGAPPWKKLTLGPGQKITIKDTAPVRWAHRFELQLR